MKKSKLLIVLIMCLFVSCAHKSGHKRLNRSAESATERESVRTPDSEDNVTSTTAEYGDNNEILNGKTIFNRYGNAVFMVFTTDGTNTYQGSGFFINSHGLAVSNYHVFKGTAIGAEQIKLVGSDTAYKVSIVVKSDEEEDFILFFVDVDDVPYIPLAKEINALIDHGSSGGALINEYGEVVGVTSGTFYDGSQANLNYAWSIDVIKPYLE